MKRFIILTLLFLLIFPSVSWGYNYSYTPYTTATILLLTTTNNNLAAAQIKKHKQLKICLKYKGGKACYKKYKN